ncbi:uncharacterized protein LOC127007558 [Eriocheir sinensis]|uniref:uncharacterized protein LOC127007558 n=1 Tax=Eriocheir sinensis TaxID=95602 RepID=UPI0021C6C50D|nr:uncharacterized protein LOC127007558 [Eriocheir sinensis]
MKEALVARCLLGLAASVATAGTFGGVRLSSASSASPLRHLPPFNNYSADASGAAKEVRLLSWLLDQAAAPHNLHIVYDDEHEDVLQKAALGREGTLKGPWTLLGPSTLDRLQESLAAASSLPARQTVALLCSEQHMRQVFSYYQ